MKTATYQLDAATAKDIARLVPPDRVRVCMMELAELIIQAQFTRDALRHTTAAQAIQGASEIGVELPDTLEWLDDGEGTIETNSFDEHGTPLMDIKLTIKPHGERNA